MESTPRTLADRFRQHGELMPPGLYRTLLSAMAADWESGGVVAEICRGWEDAPGSAVVQLRLLAGVQRLALERRAPRLLMYYPNLGGTAAPDRSWPEFEPVLREHAAELAQALSIAPQTNEPGRSAALLVGIFDAVRRSGCSEIRLLEVGASAGLNLLVDHFRIGGNGWACGPVDSPVQLPAAVHGTVRAVDYRIVERRGCDLSPIDATSQDGRLRLTSFVWPHDLDRHARLRAALAVAAAHPVAVDRSSAASWLDQQLAAPVRPGIVTVVWHSITRQYWPPSEIQAVRRVIAEAGRRLPVAQVGMESAVPGPEAARHDGFHPPELRVQLTVPGGISDSQPRLVAVVADHGVPVTMA